MNICKQIESYSGDARERLKFALTLSSKGIVLDPLFCVMSSIEAKDYYLLFKKVNGRKAKLINELETNFQYINMD